MSPLDSSKISRILQSPRRTLGLAYFCGVGTPLSHVQASFDSLPAKITRKASIALFMSPALVIIDAKQSSLSSRLRNHSTRRLETLTLRTVVTDLGSCSKSPALTAHTVEIFVLSFVDFGRI